ncbi:MBL fold metallo-hydrolase [bacterium]|nr:MBL fold metallo-hydrolase [bacterium]MBU1676184.1 MBL fold metallo-hydrolase [bacterium]
MEIKLTFCGAAGNVTGSRYLVETAGRRFYVDCGLFQEWGLKARNWEPFAVPAAEIDAVLLTHGHLDHCGLLPRLVREGFAGPVHCTRATADIAGIVMADSGRIQEEDASYKRKRHAREKRLDVRPARPLYTEADAERAIERLRPTGFDVPVRIAEGIDATFVPAGHILGAGSVHLTVGAGGERRTLVFSGDLGPWGMPILRDPVEPRQADYVVVESTYGDRDHEDAGDIPQRLARVVKETHRAGGNLIIPSFAVGRTQDLLYHLSGLLYAHEIPRIPVFVDSPMAITVTEVFRRNRELFDEKTVAVILSGEHPCDFPGLTLCRTRQESMAINDIEEPVIVIAGSGMCTAGRIKHHLVQNIGRPESTILFIGYQASGTLGRQILDGDEEVRIFGRGHRVRARIEQIHGFSAHAGQSDLLRWLSGLQTPPRRVFVTHGEPDASQPFVERVGSRLGYAASAPEYLESVTLA